MILRNRVALNEIWMDQLDDRIITEGVDEQAVKLNVGTANLMGPYGGQTALSSHRDKLDINVRFQIRKTDAVTREEIFNKVMAWASAGGWLRWNNRQEKHVRVKCTALPEFKAPEKFNEDMTITFTAFEIPYWQDRTAKVLTAQGTASKTMQIRANGNVGTPLNAEIKNVSGTTVNTMTLATGGQSISFAALGLANNETAVVDHTDRGHLRLRIRGTGGTYRTVMDKRTAQSSDDLYVQAGQDTVTFTAAGNCDITLTCFGRYL